MRTPLRSHRSHTRPAPAATHGVGRCRPGTLLLEGLIAIGIFAIFMGGIGLALLGGEASTVKAGDHGRGAFLAEEQLEILRQIRDDDLGNLVPGEYGLLYSGGTWSFTDPPVTRGGFQTRVRINALGDGWLGARSDVSWNFGKNRSGAVLLHTYFTDWKVTKPVGNWAAPSEESTTLLSGTPNLHDVVVEGDYAFLAGDQDGGGPGLFVFNVSNPALPIRVASSFNLGAGAYGLAIAGDRLYLATDNPTAEVQVFDISSPSTLTTDNLVNSYDLPGSGRARAIAIYNDTVFVGATELPSERQFYALLMSETGPMTFQDSLDVEGSVTDISLHEGYAYLSTTNNAGELRVVDTFDPTDLTFAPDTGLDLDDTYDGTVVLASGTGLLLGRGAGETIEELLLYDIASVPVPDPPPGPWTMELGGDARALDIVPGLPISFVGSTAATAELRIIDVELLAQSLSPILATVDIGAPVQSLVYDWSQDILIVITTDSLLLFSPG